MLINYAKSQLFHPPLHHTGIHAHTHPHRQTPKVQPYMHSSIHFSHACVNTHTHAHNHVFHTYENTLIRPCRRMQAVISGHMRPLAHTIESNSITIMRDEQMFFLLSMKMIEKYPLVWYLVFFFLVVSSNIPEGKFTCKFFQNKLQCRIFKWYWNEDYYIKCTKEMNLYIDENIIDIDSSPHG